MQNNLQGYITFGIEKWKKIVFLPDKIQWPQPALQNRDESKMCIAASQTRYLGDIKVIWERGYHANAQFIWKWNQKLSSFMKIKMIVKLDSILLIV